MCNKTLVLTRSALLCLMPAACAFAQTPVPSGQEIASRFKWVSPSTGVIAGLAVALVTILIVFIVIHLNSRRKNKLTTQQVSAKLFREGCVRCELTLEETDAVKALSVFIPQRESEAHHIFDNHVIFERAMEAYVQRLQRSGPSGEAQEDTLHSLRRKMGYGVLASDLPMASSRNISVGQEVAVSMPGPGRGLHPRGGQVIRVGEFSMTVKLTDGISPGLGVQPGTQIMLSFLRHGDGGYGVPAIVTAVEEWKFSVAHTLRFTRSQHRKHIRLEASLPLSYNVVEYSDPDRQPTGDIIKARTVDISGGGLCFVADTSLKMGDRIHISLQIPGYSVGGVLGKIVKVIAIDNAGGPQQYKHLTQFTDIESRQREQIVKYIFEKQREMLQMR